MMNYYQDNKLSVYPSNTKLKFFFPKKIVEDKKIFYQIKNILLKKN